MDGGYGWLEKKGFGRDALLVETLHSDREDTDDDKIKTRSIELYVFA
jgi:hypothetical protein